MKNYVSMVGTDTMAIGGSDVALDLLRVREGFSFAETVDHLSCLANGRY